MNNFSWMRLYLGQGGCCIPQNRCRYKWIITVESIPDCLHRCTYCDSQHWALPGYYPGNGIKGFSIYNVIYDHQKVAHTLPNHWQHKIYVNLTNYYFSFHWFVTLVFGSKDHVVQLFYIMPSPRLVYEP